ncbi:MAG: DNRLRE domain-containing protein [bacterium]
MQILSKKRNIQTFILYFIIAWFFSSGCSDDRPIQGFDLADPGDRGEVTKTIISSIESEESFRDTTAATGASSVLSLGSFDNIEARIVLKFENLPDTISVLGASLVLHSRAMWGESMQPFTTTIHEVTRDWNEFSVTDDTLQNGFDAVNSLGSALIFPTVGDTSLIDTLNVESVRIDFNNPQLVRSWIDSTKNNYGVLLDFSNSNFIKEFFSRNNTTNQPRLEFHFLKNDTDQDTTSVVATADAYLVRSLMEPQSGPLYVDNVFSRQSVIKFDLANIPRESTVNKAILKLNVQPENSILRNDGITIQIVRLAEPFLPPNTFKVDSLFTGIVALVKDSDSSIPISIRSMLQEWTSQEFENHGFIIRTGTPGRDISRVAFFSSAIDSSMGPKIEVDFTVSPKVP